MSDLDGLAADILRKREKNSVVRASTIRLYANELEMLDLIQETSKLNRTKAIERSLEELLLDVVEKQRVGEKPTLKQMFPKVPDENKPEESLAELADRARRVLSGKNEKTFPIPLRFKEDEHGQMLSGLVDVFQGRANSGKVAAIDVLRLAICRMAIKTCHSNPALVL